MKKKLLRMNFRMFFIAGICMSMLVHQVQAAYMKDVPMELKQPDGSILKCLATGNEYHNWLHDKNNYTIIKNPATGYYVYAIKINGKLTHSSHIAGKTNPATLGISPGLNLEKAEVIQKTANLRATKAAAVSASPNIQFAAQANAVRPASGLYNNLVIFVSFSDQAEINDPLSDITPKFNALGSASVRDFYKEVSNSQLDLVSSFFPISSGSFPISYHDSHPRSYYTKDAPDGYANGNPDATTREQTLLANAVKFVQNQVPANLLIDGNNDGNIDNIVFVINGNNEAWSDLLWPHRWSLFTQTATINGKRAYDYNIVFTESLGIGVICHELFHSFGAPDLYHYTDYPHEPSGDWDLMSGGDWSTPRHMTVYLKQHYANWVSSIPVLTNPGRYSIQPVSRSPYSSYRINLPNTNQYLVLEYRKKEGKYESSLAGDDGLLVYRINPDIIGNGDDGSEELYVFRPDGTNSVNGNLNQATFSQNKNRTRFDDFSNPSCFLADGSHGGLAANLGITNVSLAGDIISFDYKGGSTNQSPLVNITAPANNATFTATASINITATASDADGTISKVDFYNGNTLLGTDASAPYSFTWNIATAGIYTITTKATDNLGAATISTPVVITITTPVCTLQNAKLNTTFILGTNGSWSGGTGDTKDKAYDGNTTSFFDAATGDGDWTGLDLASNKKITGLRFYPRETFAGRMTGGKFQGSSSADFTSGVVDLYTISTDPSYGWNCVSINNASAFRYVRYLSPAGGFGNVCEVEFYGTSIANIPPVVNINIPVNNEAFIAPATIAINASASDADGSISKVDFYNGSSLLGTDASAPYSFTWTNIAAATYSITAIAKDNSGAVTTSAAISISVTNQTTNNCATEANPIASEFILRNDWSDQNSGSVASNTNDALDVIHRQWGRNQLWVIETGKTIAVTAGKQYTVSFDFKNDVNAPVSSVDVGIGNNIQWSGPSLLQPVVSVSGFSSSAFINKTVTFTATSNATVNLVFGLNWPSQPSVQTNTYFKNLTVCGTSSARLSALDISDNNNSNMASLVSPNPFEGQTMIRINETAAIPMKLTIADLSGKLMYQSEAYSTAEEIYIGNDLKSGVYVAQASYLGKIVTFKLVKN